MKASKDLGITKSCPNCKKTIIKSILFIGTGTFEMKCPHCQSFVAVSLGQTNTVKLNIETKVALAIVTIVVIGGLFLFGSIFFHSDKYAGDPDILIQ